jgi:membrane protease YdiL (CAAX protease family)
MQLHHPIIQFAIALAPAIFVVIWTIGSEKLSPRFAPNLAIWLDTLIKIGGATLIWWGVLWTASRWSLPSPFLGNAGALLLGLLIGAIVSGGAGTLYGLFISKKPFLIGAFGENLFRRLVGNLGVAILEETGFRGGSVFFLKHYFGDATAVLVSGLGFGVSHLAGRLLGAPVGLRHVMATTLAGCFLALVYLQYGVLACIGCHLIWNAFSRSWRKSLQIEEEVNLQQFESSWPSLLVLVVMCAVLLWMR